jgi:hypothetical protein
MASPAKKINDTLLAAFKKHASRLASLRDSSCIAATAGFRLRAAGKSGAHPDPVDRDVL